MNIEKNIQPTPSLDADLIVLYNKSIEKLRKKVEEMQTMSGKKRTINDHKITVPSKLIEYFRSKSNKGLCQDLKPLVEDIIEQKIRKVICYNEKTANGGFCDTCSFFYSVVDIYFKSSDGDLCVLTVEAEMGDLLRKIEELSKDTVL